MADADQSKEPEKQKKAEQESSPKKNSKLGLHWVIMAAVVIACAGLGFGLGRLFAGSGRSRATETSPSHSATPDQPENSKSDVPDLAGKDSHKTWYYDLEPVVANLNEPGVTRYIRVSLTLQINSEVAQKKGIAYLEEKKPVLTNWLTIYLAGLSLEEIRGDRNLKRIQSYICDAFNEKLFPDAKPQIRRILFKEFAIQ